MYRVKRRHVSGTVDVSKVIFLVEIIEFLWGYGIIPWTRKRGKYMDKRVEKAVELHKNGYNCAQSVVCAFADEFGADMETTFRISEGFGGGIGDMQGMCGALSGAIMAVSLANSEGTENKKTKGKTYSAAKEMKKKFEGEIGSVICKEIKGLETGKVLRSCSGCVEEGAAIVVEYLDSRER